MVVVLSLFFHLILFQLLQKGTQLLSEMLDDSSLSVLIDQMESVRFQPQFIQLHFCIHLNLCIQVFAVLDMKSDSSARKLIQSARTLASEMSTKTGLSSFHCSRISPSCCVTGRCAGEKVLIEAKALIKDIGAKGVASVMCDPSDVMRSIVQDRPLSFLKDHHARIDAIQRSIVRYVVELLPRLSLPVYTGTVSSSPIGELSLVLNNIRFSELQVPLHHSSINECFECNTSKILEDNVKFRSRLLDDDSDPMKLRATQSILHFRCHDVNVNIDGALWAYR